MLIGNIEIKNKVILAPMAGVSDPAYIRICEEMGASLAYTELISAEAIIRDNKKTFDMLKGIEKVHIPVGIQIFGSNKEVLSKAAKIIEKKYNPALIDINMGCPVPKVAVRAKSGSYLLKDPSNVYEIVKQVVSSVSVPVTVKIRSGWNSINAVEIAKKIEKAGASAITIHPRTRAQGYSGKSDWNIIKEVKENVNIPVIGNGDIKTEKDVLKMLNETKCDAVMIGRALIGNPWLIKNTNLYLNDQSYSAITKEEKINIAKKHLDYLIEDKGEKVAVKEMRMHISHYLKGLSGSKEVKEKLFKVTTSSEFKEILNKYKEGV